MCSWRTDHRAKCRYSSCFFLLERQSSVSSRHYISDPYHVPRQPKKRVNILENADDLTLSARCRSWARLCLPALLVFSPLLALLLATPLVPAFCQLLCRDRCYPTPTRPSQPVGFCSRWRRWARICLLPSTSSRTWCLIPSGTIRWICRRL